MTLMTHVSEIEIFDELYPASRILENYLIGIEAIGYLKHVMLQFTSLHAECETRIKSIMQLVQYAIQQEQKEVKND